jgi:tubulin polyglutamylase TTLL6/13
LKWPALINGHKFDFRIYVLVTSVVEPLTVFLFNDGLIRLASEKYQCSKNSTQDMYVHLTNYSLNKKNTHFDGEKHKLRLSDFLPTNSPNTMFSTSTEEKGTHSKKCSHIWTEIEDIVIKTIITVQPQLQHIYRSCQAKEPDICYELLGFDIMLDAKLKPWLLEVNHLPSFNSDTQVDESVKSDLIKNIFQILQLSIVNRKKVF